MKTALAVAACLVVACHHDTPGPVAPPSNKVEDPNAATARDALGFLPVDSEIVLSIDAHQLASSALWGEYWPKFEAKVAETITKVNAACGLDVWRKTERVTMAIEKMGEGTPAGVFVVRGPEVGRILECIAADKSAGAVVTRDHDVVISKKGDDVVAATVVGGSALVIQLGAQANAISLAAIVGGGAPLRKSPVFVTYYDQLDPHASLWIVLNGNGSLAKQLAAMGVHAKSIYGTLTITDKLVLAARVALATPDEASQLSGMVGPQLQAAKSMFDKLDVSANGPVVAIDATMTSAQLSQILTLVGLGS